MPSRKRKSYLKRKFRSLLLLRRRRKKRPSQKNQRRRFLRRRRNNGSLLTVLNSRTVKRPLLLKRSLTK